LETDLKKVREYHYRTAESGKQGIYNVFVKPDYWPELTQEASFLEKHRAPLWRFELLQKNCRDMYQDIEQVSLPPHAVDWS
jgi:hypothetical protein